MLFLNKLETLNSKDLFFHIHINNCLDEKGVLLDG